MACVLCPTPLQTCSGGGQSFRGISAEGARYGQISAGRMAYRYAPNCCTGPGKANHVHQMVFRAQGELRPGLPAEIRIGDSVVMISGGDGLRDPAVAFLYVYVEDADSTYKCAIAANAVSLEVPTDLPYGDRRAMVRDEWGNTWQIATHKHDLSVAEIRSRLANDG
jgi:PhnB protein